MKLKKGGQRNKVFQLTRREGALKRLLEQLKEGKKTAKRTSEKVDLTDKDKKRIEKEIEVLKSHVKLNSNELV